LPDADAVFGGEVEFVGGLDVEGGIPAVFVTDGEGAVLSGWVVVGEGLLVEGSIAGDTSPVWAKAMKNC
jgi:hypothetical protein